MFFKEPQLETYQLIYCCSVKEYKVTSFVDQITIHDQYTGIHSYKINSFYMLLDDLYNRLQTRPALPPQTKPETPQTKPALPPQTKPEQQPQTRPALKPQTKLAQPPNKPAKPQRTRPALSPKKKLNKQNHCRNYRFHNHIQNQFNTINTKTSNDSFRRKPFNSWHTATYKHGDGQPPILDLEPRTS